MSEDKDQLTDHEYDGIQEYDNPLPNWWLMTFFATIMFAVLYVFHYMSGAGPNLKQELDASMKVLAQMQASAPKKELGDQELLARFKSVDLKAAEALFESKCAACHGDHLQGVIGPNLTDEYWIHGKGTPKDIVAVISEGVADKGMPTWKDLLKEDEIVELADFILSKQDSHPAGAKAPQGEKVR
jgi:cytochrome c oxidase cbb3-type subunit 3